MSQDPTPTPAAAQPMDYASVTAATGYTGPAPTPDETNMATLTYILAIFTGFIGPLIIWMMKKDQSKFVDDQGKEVLNWCITTFIASLVSSILIFVFIGIFLLIGVWIAHIVLTIMGALKVRNGVAYRYPFAIRLLK